MSYSGVYYELPYSDYRSAEGVSQSEIKTLITTSPMHYQHTLTAERKRMSKCLRVGDATHHLLLQPEDFDNTVAVLPSQWNDYRKTAAQEWRDEVESQGLHPITRHENWTIRNMAAAVRRHPYAGRLFSRGKPEVSIFDIHEETGVKRKGRLDWLTDPELIADGPIPILDIKTCESAALLAFEKTVRKYKYYLQASYYLDLAQAAGLPHSCFIIVALESSPPHAVELYQIGPASLARGREEYQSGLRMYKTCADSGDWPGYNTGINIIEIV